MTAEEMFKVFKMPRLPMWDEIKDKRCEIYIPNINNKPFMLDITDKKITISINNIANTKFCKLIFTKEKTKETYTEACRLCVKLFKGE